MTLHVEVLTPDRDQMGFS